MRLKRKKTHFIFQNRIPLFQNCFRNTKEFIGLERVNAVSTLGHIPGMHVGGGGGVLTGTSYRPIDEKIEGITRET